MSRNLELNVEVPIGLHYDVGGINIFAENAGMCMNPRISLPGQYLLAMDHLFEDEPWEGGYPRSSFGVEDSGIAKLDDWPADKAAAMIRRAISRIKDSGDDEESDFWDATPRNVRRLLEAIMRITEYAVENEPTASWTLWSV